MQIGLSSWLKNELGWNDWEVTKSQGIAAIADIAAQIILGAVTNYIKVPFLLKLNYLFSAIYIDWIIFFFTEYSVLKTYWADIIDKKGELKT